MAPPSMEVRLDTLQNLVANSRLEQSATVWAFRAQKALGVQAVDYTQLYQKTNPSNGSALG